MKAILIVNPVSGRTMISEYIDDIYDAVYHIHTCRQIILVYRFRGSTKGTEDDYERIYGVLCAS